MWENVADGALDDASEHTPCPTLKGTKWAATAAVHRAPKDRSNIVNPVRMS